MKSIRLASLALSAAVAAAAVYAFSARPLPVFADTQVRADRLQINGLARIGQRLVAVGEAGHILFSDDLGVHWKDADVAPQSGSTLNQLSFSDHLHGLAVGHDGVIVKTGDGGAHWRQVRFDEQHSEPLLGVSFIDANTAFAVGGFGKVLMSHDAGSHWSAPSSMPDIADGHVNALVAGEDGRMLLVGEAGMLQRSSDGGAQWEALALPYKGSLFGGMALSANTWLVYGMRGHVFRTEDFGSTWTQVETGLPTSFFGGARLQDGRIVLVGQGGAMLVSRDAGKRFRIHRVGGRASLTSVVELAPGKLLVGGEAGVSADAL